MAIVKMKRLRLMGMRSERESLLHLLQKLGCVEVDEPAIDLSDPKWAAVAKPDSRDLSAAKERSTLLNNALNILKKYAPAKEGLFRIRPRLTEKEFFNPDFYQHGLDTARAIVEGERTLASLTALEQLGLIERRGSRYQPVEVTGKKDLSSAPVLRRLAEGEG